jgi:beta-xylosidase
LQACGFQYNHNVSVFTSPDLKTWEAFPPAFQMASSSLTDAILFCPKVLYNANTKLYVMWFNWIAGANFGDSYYAVATSASATGPFTLVSPNVTTLAWSNTGDFSLFQDDDGTAYVIYTAHIQGYATTHQMSVERLTPDYLASEGSAGNSGFFGQSFVEAPSMFKRNGVYYTVFGECCCYCEAGNPVTIYTSANPLGPYTARNVLDPSGVPAQQSNIFPWYDATGQQQFMWYGDRWQSAPDGIKGHDFTYWSALAFQPDGNVTSFGFADNFTINI